MKWTIVSVYAAVPVQDVYVIELTPDDGEYRVDDGGEVRLVEHDKHGVGCVTSSEGSFIEPTLNVSLGNRDVTDLFELYVDRRSVLLESGLTVFHVTVRRTFVTSQPDADVNGQVITCTAAVQSGYRDVTASAVVNVECKKVCCMAILRIVSHIW